MSDLSVQLSYIDKFVVGNVVPRYDADNNPPGLIIGGGPSVLYTTFARRVGTVVTSGAEHFEVWSVSQGYVSGTTSMRNAGIPNAPYLRESGWYKDVAGGMSDYQQYVVAPVLVLRKIASTDVDALADFEGEVEFTARLRQRTGAGANGQSRVDVYNDQVTILRAVVRGQYGNEVSTGRAYAGDAGMLTGSMTAESNCMASRQRIGTPFPPFYEPGINVYYSVQLKNYPTVGELQRFVPFPAQVNRLCDEMTVGKFEDEIRFSMRLEPGLLMLSGSGGGQTIRYTRFNTAARRQWQYATSPGAQNNQVYTEDAFKTNVSWLANPQKSDLSVNFYSVRTPFSTLGPYMPLNSSLSFNGPAPPAAYVSSGMDVRDNTFWGTYPGNGSGLYLPEMKLLKQNEGGWGRVLESGNAFADPQTYSWTEFMVSSGAAYDHTSGRVDPMAAQHQPSEDWWGFGSGTVHFPSPSLLCAHASNSIKIRIRLGFPLAWGIKTVDSGNVFSTWSFQFQTQRSITQAVDLGNRPAYIVVGLQDHYIDFYSADSDVPFPVSPEIVSFETASPDARRVVVSLEPVNGPTIFTVNPATSMVYTELQEQYAAINGPLDNVMSYDMMNSEIVYTVPNRKNRRWIGTSIYLGQQAGVCMMDQCTLTPPAHGVVRPLSAVVNSIAVEYKDSGFRQNRYAYSGITPETQFGGESELSGAGEARGGQRFENAARVIGTAGKKSKK